LTKDYEFTVVVAPTSSRRAEPDGLLTKDYEFTASKKDGHARPGQFDLALILDPAYRSATQAELGGASKRRPIVRRWQIPAIVAITAWLAAFEAKAQQAIPNFNSPAPAAPVTPAPAANPLAQRPNAPPPPVCRYPITAQAGEWLVFVQTFKGPQAQALAEELAEILIRDYKLTAYVYDRGYKERMAEWQRYQQVRDQYWDTIEVMKKQGIEPAGTLHFRWVRIPDEFGVLVKRPDRDFKDMTAAKDFLVNDLHKRKPLPDKFATQVSLAPEPENEKHPVKMFNPNMTGYLNPFMTAMVVHNPTTPVIKEQEDPEKTLSFLKRLNESEPYNLLKCKKPWTLVVKVYQGPAVLAPQNQNLLSRWLGLNKSEAEGLSASAMNCHNMAELLRHMKPSFEAYVMHHRSYSILAVGQYDDLNDPNLIANQKALADFKIVDKRTGAALDTLNPTPQPMQIPH
jgi:hypothetical protein